MNLDVKSQQQAWREAYLIQEEELYRKTFGTTFQKIKDWDDKGPVVIWEGEIHSSTLARKYRVQIHYAASYPYERPSVYVLEPQLQNLRHQAPSRETDDLSGALCLFPHTPDYWRVGMTCLELMERTVYWLTRYEAGALGDEFAPPEIERYFAPAQCLTSPVLIVAENLVEIGEQRTGSAFILPTASGKAGFFSLFPAENETEAWVNKVSDLASLIFPLDPTNYRQLVSGRWVCLREEPALPVPQSSADLMELLLKNAHLSPAEVAAFVHSQPQFVACCYATASSPLHWLIFATKFDYQNAAGFRPKSFLLKLRAINRRHASQLYPVLKLQTWVTAMGNLL